MKLCYDEIKKRDKDIAFKVLEMSCIQQGNNSVTVRALSYLKEEENENS